MTCSCDRGLVLHHDYRTLAKSVGKESGDGTVVL
jgi:hypothetical protein